MQIKRFHPILPRIALALYIAGCAAHAQDIIQVSPPPGLLLGDQLAFLSLSYVVNGAGKTLPVGTDCYPDHQDFQPIAIYPDQTLQINLQFPSNYVGQIIFVGVEEENASGGIVMSSTSSGAVATDTDAYGAVSTSTPPRSVAAPIGTDGTVSIGYQAPHNPGHYHVLFGFGPLKPVLPFTVLDSDEAARPGNCPRTN
jgi:hypothetical protein